MTHISRLSPKQRPILERHMNDMSPKQIAQELGLNNDDVGKTIRRFKAKMSQRRDDGTFFDK